MSSAAFSQFCSSTDQYRPARLTRQTARNGGQVARLRWPLSVSLSALDGIARRQASLPASAACALCGDVVAIRYHQTSAISARQMVGLSLGQLHAGDHVSMKRIRERQRILFAVIASLLLHFAVAVSLASFRDKLHPPVPEEEKPAELTIV